MAILVLLSLLLSLPLFAQNPSGDQDFDPIKKLKALENEMDSLRQRIEKNEASQLDQNVREEKYAVLYGRIGTRYHWLFEDTRETLNVPEFRAQLGLFGTAYDDGDQIVRYDLRIRATFEDVNNKPVPTLAWGPFPGNGAGADIAFDRMYAEIEVLDFMGLAIGRAPTPYQGTEMVWDQDFTFQGVTGFLHFESLFDDDFRKHMPRLRLKLTASYLGANTVGLPTAYDTVTPMYIGGQLQMSWAPFADTTPIKEGEVRQAPGIFTDVELRLSLGVHHVDGEETISKNIGVGYISSTTNVLDSGGDVISDFLIAEVFFELVFMRSRRANIVFYGHYINNIRAHDEPGSQSERNEHGVAAGMFWGMPILTERWDFRASFEYFYIEPDATIPEFNSEVLNTNIKGWDVSVFVTLFKNVTVFSHFSVFERKDFEKRGFGIEEPDGRSGTKGFRIRTGLFLEF
ncbi:MAG: putative porin [Planctomycetota bacterium]